MLRARDKKLLLAVSPTCTEAETLDRRDARRTPPFQRDHHTLVAPVATTTAADSGGRDTEHAPSPPAGHAVQPAPSIRRYLAPPARAPSHSSAGRTRAVRG